MPPRTGRSAEPPAVRPRVPARVGGLVAGTATLLLAGCALNAGTAANDAFVAHMEGVDGVTAADGSLSNTLPFLGTGPVEVRLGAGASEETLRSAVEHALAFDPAPGTSVTDLRLGPGADDPTAAAAEHLASVSFEVEWDTPATTAVDRLLALRQLPGVLLVDHERLLGDVRLRVTAGSDACALADDVERTLDASPGSVERVEVDDGTVVDRSTCDG